RGGVGLFFDGPANPVIGKSIVSESNATRAHVSFIRLFLIEGNFGKDRRFDQFGFLLFLSGIHRLPAGIDETRGDEDHEVTFDMLLGVAAKETADKWDVAKNWRAVFSLLHILAHQTAQHHRLPIPHTYAGGNLSGTEDRLVNDVRR